MPGAFKSSRDSTTSDSSDNNQHRATSATSHGAPTATAMRATNANRNEGRYEVAGPTMGGSPTPYDSGNVESPKDSNNTTLTRDTEAGHARKSSLSETVIAGAATAASTAASTAAAAGASVLAAAKKLVSGDDNDAHLHDRHTDDHDRHTDDHDRAFPASDSNASAATAHGDNQGLEFSHRAVGPNDRSPAKIDIRAMKPSPKATYGNLDSPGAHNMPGPLSDRTLMGTPPLPGGNQQKTFADPFGPVRVSNWNDGKHQAEVSTPTSDDFDMHLGSPVIKSQPFTASSAASGSLHDEIPSHHADTTPAANYRAPGHVDAITTSPEVGRNSNNLGTGAAIGAGAATAGLGAATHASRQNEHDHVSTKPSTSSNISPAPRVPADSKRIPIAQPPSDPHSVSNTTQSSSRIAPSTSAGAAAMGAASAPLASHTASNAAHPQGATTAQSVDKKDTVIDKVMNIFHHDSSQDHHDVPKDNTHLFASSNAATLLAQQQYAEKHAGQAHQQTQPQQYGSAAPGSHSSSTVPKHAAVAAVPMAAGATAASLHRPHTHGLPAHEGEDPIHHNTSTIATSSAAPEILASRTDHVPASQVHSYQQHHQHLSHEGGEHGHRDNLSTSNVAVPSGAAAGLAGGATGARLASAAYMGNKSEMVAPRDISHENIVDKTLPPAPSQHTAYLPPSDGTATKTSADRGHGPSAASTIGAAGLGAAAGAGAAKAYQHHNTDAAASSDISHKNAPVGPAPETDRSNVDRGAPGKATMGPTVNPAYADAPAVQNMSSTKVHDARPLAQKLADDPSAVGNANASHSTRQNAGKTAAAAGVASGAGFTAYLGSKESLNRHGVAHPEDHTAEHQQQHRPLAEKIRGAFGAPLYGPADPMDLPLTDPKTLLPLPTNAKVPAARTSPKGEAVSAAAATTAGAAAGTAAYLGDKESRKTSGQHLGDQSSNHHQHRRRSLGEIIKETVGSHNYGPADPKDLHLTDPKTVRPPGSIASNTASSAATGAATAADVGAGAHYARGEDATKHHDTTDATLRTSAPTATNAGTVGSDIHAQHAKDDARKYDSTTSSAVPALHSYKPSANVAGPATAAATAGAVGAGIHATRNKDDTKIHDAHASSTVPTSHTSVPVVNTAGQTKATHSTAPVAAAGLTGAAAGTAASLGAHQSSAAAGPTAYRDNVQPGNLNSGLGTRSQHLTDTSSNVAPPADYHGQVPQVKPGEEVLWVKKITTTDYYDGDENANERGGVIEDSNRDMAGHHANVNTSNTDYGSKQHGSSNPDTNVQRQEQPEHGNQRHHHGGLVDRLLGRHHDETDKGKQRL
ncbi:hypothetical protein BGZ70_000427 [Mortierella alpina]|uniref:Uncharacterized protein n=1 Tax=Mortierella alpina TaxID=64518 RepID=A0A9P6IYG0_MORAP|nr:hypothetical protein BGZ70_000427 [Mortierella alpina]